MSHESSRVVHKAPPVRVLGAREKGTSAAAKRFDLDAWTRSAL